MYILKKYENYFLVRENQKPFIIFRRVSPSVFCLLFFVVVLLLFVFLEGGRGGGWEVGEKERKTIKVRNNYSNTVISFTTSQKCVTRL